MKVRGGIRQRAAKGTWGVWVGPGLFVTGAVGIGPPSRFHQWWQRLLLGWQWDVMR